VKNLLTALPLGIVNVLIIVFLVAPVIVVIGTAFTTTGYPVFPPQGFTFKWFQRFLATEGFMESVWLSTTVALSTMAISSVLGTFAALGIGRWRFFGRAPIATFMMLPILFPATVMGLSLLIFFSSIGLSGSVHGLVIAHTIVATPFVIRMVTASLGEFDPAVEEAARNLGAGWWRTFFLITLPLIRPGLLAGALISFIISFDELVVTLFLAGPRLETVPVRIYTYIEFNTDPTVSAISTTLIAVWMLIGAPLYARFLSVKR
jgi:putative spermidine/putrescine transport system permease protein